MVFPCPGAMFWDCFGLPCLLFSMFCSRAGNVVSSSFGMVSDDTLDSFSVLLCDFSALHWDGASLSGSHVLWAVVPRF